MKFRIILLTAALIAASANVHSQSTGLALDFSMPLDGGWKNDTQYSLHLENGSLRSDVDKFAAWAGFKYVLPSTLDISANPIVSLKLRGSLPFVFYVYLTDSVNNVLRSSRVHYSGDKFGEYLFEFTDPGSVDLTKVKELIFAVNGDALSWIGTFWMDDLRIGDQASKIAGLASVMDMTVAANTTSVTVQLTDIINTASLNLSGGDALIENVAFSAISNQMATLTFDCKPDATGSDIVTITAAGANGYNDYPVDFNLTVEGNNPPVMNAVNDIDAPVGQNIEVMLAGISDANSSLEQAINISVTNSDGLVISNPEVSYDHSGPYAKLTFTTLQAGTSTIDVELQDDGAANNSSTYSFDVVVYDNFNNPPNFDIQSLNEMFLSNGTIEIPLNNVTDGDDNSQILNYSANSLNTAVISNPVQISYIEGNPSKPKIVCNAIATGVAQIEVSVSDEATGSGNGNQTSTKTITVDVIEAPLTGLIIDPANFDADYAAQKYKIESEGISQTISNVVFDGSECLHINCISKGTWTGFWYRTPDLDLSKNPYISYEVYSVDNAIQTHAYFYDNFGERNVDGAHAERKDVPANQWTTVLLDYRQAGELLGSGGELINISRLDTILFNYHPSFGWPFTDYAGELYIRNIRIGDAVTIAPVLTPSATLDDIPDQSVFVNTGSYNLKIGGISAGENSLSEPVATLTFDQSQTVFSGISLSSINSSGEAELNYTTSENKGSVTVTIEISASGSDSVSKSFVLEAVDNQATNLATVDIDLSERSQRFFGFGAYRPDRNYIDQFVSDAGGTIVRLQMNGDEIEPLNDNSNPDALDKSKLDYSHLDLDYIKFVHEAGVDQFFVTVFTAPSWMKQNLSTNYQQPQAPGWESTTNKVDPIYYDEYVEFMVAIVEIIKEETGVELAGICPQNEPAFCEPYVSGILDPVHMAEVCGMLGEKLAQKGFATRVINSEQVFNQSHYSVNEYIDQVQLNATANQYTQIIGMHYPDNNAAAWAGQYANCQEGSYPKELWATECSAVGNDWANVMGNISEIITGLNNGLSSWDVASWNRGPLFSNDYNPVGDQLGVVYGGTPSRHFYALKNLYQSIRPGAYHVASTSDNSVIKATVFINDSDSSLAVILQNTGNAAVKCRLTGNLIPNAYKAYRTSRVEKYVETDPFYEGMILLPASSITTLIGKTGANNSPTMDPLTDIELLSGDGEQVINLSGITDGDANDQELSLAATVSPAGIITDPLITYSSPDATGTLTFSTLTDQAGTAVITITVKDNGGTENGGIDSLKISFSVVVSLEDGIEDLSSLIKYYPNPVKDKLMIQLPGSSDNTSIFIYNSMGMMIGNNEINFTGNNMSVDMSELSSGLYFVEINSNKLHQILKIVKE